MARRRGGSAGELNVWPAFVDVLATLLLVIILLVLVVSVTQFYTANRANQAEAVGSVMSDQLQVQDAQIRELEAARANLLSQLSVQFDELNILTEDRDAALESAEQLLARIASTDGETLDLEGNLAAAITAMDEKVVRLLSVLDAAERERDTLAAQSASLDAENAELSASLSNLGERINDSLLLEAEELARQRSLFFGALIDTLGDRDDVSVVGDRFVFQSEVLFDSGSADLGVAGQAQLSALGDTILALAADFPADLDWILRIDGHTDARAIGANSDSGFANNWQLSTARARSVVEHLIGEGVPGRRLAAAGFGEFQPLDTATTEQAYARNRRIEIKLTTR